MARVNEKAPERGALEYVTYAPAGHDCAECLRPLKSMEVARRIALDQTSGPPVATYRHANDCPKLVAG